MAIDLGMVCTAIGTIGTAIADEAGVVEGNGEAVAAVVVRVEVEGVVAIAAFEGGDTEMGWRRMGKGRVV